MSNIQLEYNRNKYEIHLVNKLSHLEINLSTNTI